MTRDTGTHQAYIHAIDTSEERRPGIVKRAFSALGDLLNRIVADREPNRRPPMSNYMPNSDGEGGRVISSGHPGGGH